MLGAVVGGQSLRRRLNGGQGAAEAFGGQKGGRGGSMSIRTRGISYA